MKSYNKTIAAIAITGATLAGGAAGALIAGGAAGAQDATTSTTAPAAAPTPAPGAATPADPNATPPPDQSTDQGTGQGTGQGQRPQGSQTPGSPRGQRPPKDPSAGGHQANGKTEALLSGDELAKVTAAAAQAAPGATIERAETDAEGDAYEAHIVQPDGTRATIKFAADFSVVRIETGPAT